MEPVNIFGVANKQADWLAVRQKTIAGNVANANTPGYKARDVQDFSSILKNNPVSMAVTNKAHMQIGGNLIENTAMRAEDTIEITHSGNDVNLEEEMRKGGEVGREMSMNTAVVKAFHRMMIAAVKGAS